MKFFAKDKDISSVSLAGKEYKRHGDTIEVPDDHHDAIKAASVAGLEHAVAGHAVELTEHEVIVEESVDEIGVKKGRKA